MSRDGSTTPDTSTSDKPSICQPGAPQRLRGAPRSPPAGRFPGRPLTPVIPDCVNRRNILLCNAFHAAIARDRIELPELQAIMCVGTDCHAAACVRAPSFRADELREPGQA